MSCTLHWALHVNPVSDLAIQGFVASQSNWKVGSMHHNGSCHDRFHAYCVDTVLGRHILHATPRSLLPNRPGNRVGNSRQAILVQQLSTTQNLVHQPHMPTGNRPFEKNCVFVLARFLPIRHGNPSTLEIVGTPTQLQRLHLPRQIALE